jgi:hypothetical protein
MCFIIVVVSHKLSILAFKRQPQKLLIYDAIHLNEKHSGFLSVFCEKDCAMEKHDT